MRRFLAFGLAVIAAMLLADVWWFDSDDYRVAANLGLIGVAALTTMFTARYAFWSKWWTNRLGRAYLAFKLMMTAALWQIVVTVWWDNDFPGRHQLRTAIYYLAVLGCAMMIAALVREQRPEHRPDVDRR